MSNYEPKYKEVANGNSVELSQFRRAGDFTEIAEVARVADEKGDIDTVNQKVKLPESYVEKKIGTGLSDILEGAATVVDSTRAWLPPSYAAREAERQTDRLNAETDSDDFKKVKQMLSSSESKRKAAYVGAVSGVGTAAVGSQIVFPPVAGWTTTTIGGLVGGYSVAKAASESDKIDAYAQEAGKGWERSYGHYDVELV